MDNKETSDVEQKFLEPFLSNTPLGIIRLQEAWDILSPVQKSFLIEETLTSDFSARRLRFELETFFMSETSPYLRSLAAKHIAEPWIRDREPTEFEKKQLALLEKVENDPSDLVKTSKLASENQLPWRMEPEEFWNHPHAWRLVQLSGKYHHEEAYRIVAEILTYAISNLEKNDFTLDQIQDVLIEYLTWNKKALLKRIENAKYTGFRDYHGYDPGLEKLWRLIPELPLQLKITLLRDLPQYREGIPEGLIQDLSKDEISILLGREDIEMLEERRMIWEGKFRDYAVNETSLNNAITHPKFTFEFRELLSLRVLESNTKDEAKEKLGRLKTLSWRARGATLVQLIMIRNILDQVPDEFPGSSGLHNYMDWLDSFLDDRHEWLKQYSEDKLNREVLQCQLLDQCSVYGYEAEHPYLNKNHYLKTYPDLKDYIKVGDKLGTFVNIMEGINKQKLPHIEAWARHYEYLPPMVIGNDYENEYDAIEYEMPPQEKKGFWSR